MIGKRGIRRAATRIRLAVAAAVLVGGGAAGFVAVAANHGGTTAAQSAGYYTHSGGRWMSETQAMSAAMNGWNSNSNRSLQDIAQMRQMSTFNTMAWHRHVIALQRGTVVAESIRQRELVVQSANGRIEVWHWNGGTKAVNVGASSMGMSALTGGTMVMPSWANHLNTQPRAAIVGDMVFVFGEKVNGKLIAQLVLFIAPANPVTVPAVTPTATPSVTATATAVPTGMPASTATATARPTATMTFAGNHS